MGEKISSDIRYLAGHKLSAQTRDNCWRLWQFLLKYFSLAQAEADDKFVLYAYTKPKSHWFLQAYTLEFFWYVKDIYV